MKLILAADEHWGIGKDGGLLWHLPGDLRYFKEKTRGKTVVMGRKTFESLPGKKPLPDRVNIVLTGQEDYRAEGIITVHSRRELEEELNRRGREQVMIIGGGKIYREFLPECDTCYITKIYRSFDADTFFVDLDEDGDFEIVWESEIQEENGIRYRFVEYRRKEDVGKQTRTEE